MSRQASAASGNARDYRSQHCRLFPESCFRYNGQLNSKIFESEPQLQQQQAQQTQQAQTRTSTPTKTVRNSSFNAPEPPKKSAVIEGLKDNLPLDKLRLRTVGKLASKNDAKLQELEDSMFLISGKKAVPGFTETYQGKKFKVFTNAKENKLRITFEGAGPTDKKNVLNVVTNKKLVGKDIDEEEKFLANLFKNGSEKVKYQGTEYTDIKMLGHSLGGYKARTYGAKYDVDSELLNAHIMPWNKFEQTSAKIDMHTIITDPTDLKFLIEPKGNLTHTYYQPLESSQISGESEFMDPHYGFSWQNLERDEQSQVAEVLKTKYPSIAANTAFGSLAVAGSIYEAVTNKGYNPRFDPMLGAIDDPLGLNLDPDYQWGDVAPSGDADYLIWKSLQPIVKAIASSSNPTQDLARGKRIEQEAGSTLSSKLYTFDYKGEEYFYQKDESGSPTWFSVDGAPLDQAIKDAYNSKP